MPKRASKKSIEDFDSSEDQNMVYTGTLHTTLRICLADYETERIIECKRMKVPPDEAMTDLVLRHAIDTCLFVKFSDEILSNFVKVACSIQFYKVLNNAKDTLDSDSYRNFYHTVLNIEETTIDDIFSINAEREKIRILVPDELEQESDQNQQPKT